MQYKWLIFAACIVLLAGCSNKPSESVMADQIEHSINQQFGVEFIEVEDLEKINARKNGDDKYIADLAFDIEYTKSLAEVGAAMREDSPAHPNAPQVMTQVLLSSFATMGLKAAFGDFKKGDKKHVENQFTFVKSENGWVLMK